MTFSHAANVIEPDFFARLRNKKDPYKTDKAEAARTDARERLPFEYAQRAATLLVPHGAPNHNILTLGHALAYADAGLHVIDAHALDRAGVGTGPGKQIKLPRGARWQERATTDQIEIEKFWSGDGEYPEDDHGKAYPYVRPNVFRNVSAAFPKDCGLFVLDIDGDAGLDALEALEQEHGELPQTWESITGSGGVHLIFQARDLDIRNTASSIASGVDIRGANGQIIVPPSIHPSGNFYRWEIDCAPWECPVADAPDWLCKLAYEATKGRTEKKTKPKKASKKTTKDKRASARADQSSNDAHGVDEHLALIGDGEGQKGFNAPIYSALCSYFGTHGADAPVERILDEVKDAISNAERDPERDRSKYDDENYLLEQAEKARNFIAARDCEARVRAFLRRNLTSAEGTTQISEGAEEEAVQRLTDSGIDEDVARQRVQDAVDDIVRQLASRTERETAEDDDLASVPHVLDPLFDQDLVDEDGFIVKPADHPEAYQSYGIETANEQYAFTAMRLEIRDQIFRSMDRRFEYVVLDGEAKVAIRPQSGNRVLLWGENTLNKLYLNMGAKFWDESGSTPKVKDIKPAEVWLTRRARSTFFDTCFEPDAAKAASAAAARKYNLWNGFAAIAEPGDWSLLRDHIKSVLCNGNDDHYNFLMTALASLFQRPGVKVPCALAFIGEQGTGKSKLWDWVRRAIGASALKVSAMRHLTGNFNAHLDGLILLVCEEAFWAGHRGEGGVLKDLISSETLQIEGKFQNVVERPNYVFLVFISNNAWVVPTDGKDARRFFVLECSNEHKQDGVYFGNIDDQMERGGMEAMVHDLMTWDPACIGGWEALRNPPETEARRRQVALGLSGPASRLPAALTSGVVSGRTPDGDVFHYDLSDDSPTDIAKTHIVAALDPGGQGNITDAMKQAISTFLGPDADHGDNKKQIEYLGEHRVAKGDTVAERIIKKTEERVRYITVPALSQVKAVLAEHGWADDGTA